jgi:hypothetical protein
VKISSLLSFLLRSSVVGAFAGSLALTAQSAIAAPPIKPVYQTNFVEGAVKTPAGTATPSSFGYFFDTNFSDIRLNALGIPNFSGWDNSAGAGIYPNAKIFDVYVWRIDGINQPSLAPCNGTTPYCQVAKVTFDADLANTYILQDGYYWQPITPVNLGAESDTSVNLQYATAAVGNFSVTDGLPTLVGPPNGGGPFDPAFAWTGNGFNVAGSTPDYSADFPVPWNFVSDPSSANDPLTYYGYFSPNLSYNFVPSPIPILGAGAAFGWARKIRRRVKAESTGALS